MDTVTFLEQLAKNVPHHESTERLLEQQPNEIKIAYLSDNIELLKTQFLNVGYLANEVDTLQI